MGVEMTDITQQNRNQIGKFDSIDDLCDQLPHRRESTGYA
jgi:hypothetical protein